MRQRDKSYLPHCVVEDIRDEKGMLVSSTVVHSYPSGWEGYTQCIRKVDELSDSVNPLLQNMESLV